MSGPQRGIAAGALVLGLAARLWLIGLAPQYAYSADHDDAVRWGIQATDRGITTLYREPPPRWPYEYRQADGEVVLVERSLDRIFTYPPLSAYVVGLGGLIHARLSDDRHVNTLTARAVFSGFGIAADVLIALGCAAVVRARCGERYEPPGSPRQTWAGAAAFLLPPLMIDSAYWGQTESWVLAPAVWMVAMMMRGRWAAAGVLLGAALGLKQQAVLLSPLWLYALLFVPQRRAVVVGIAAALVVLNVAAAPFWLTSGGAWLFYSYISSILLEFPATTLRAFNVWYVDLLLSGVHDSTAPLLGLSRDAAGRTLLAAAVIVGLALARRRWRADAMLWPMLAAWALVAAVMLPTRVHERYIVLPLPFLVCAAFGIRRLWPGAVALVLAGTFQITSHDWSVRLADAGTEASIRQAYERRFDAASPDERAVMPPLQQVLDEHARQRAIDRPREWALTLLALSGAAWTAVSMSRRRTDAAPPESAKSG